MTDNAPTDRTPGFSTLAIHAGAGDPDRRPDGEAADVVEGRAQRDLLGAPQLEPAHLKREVRERSETHEDEAADDQIPGGVALHGFSFSWTRIGAGAAGGERCGRNVQTPHNAVIT